MTVDGDSTLCLLVGPWILAASLDFHGSRSEKVVAFGAFGRSKASSVCRTWKLNRWRSVARRPRLAIVINVCLSSLCNSICRGSSYAGRNGGARRVSFLLFAAEDEEIVARERRGHLRGF